MLYLALQVKVEDLLLVLKQLHSPLVQFTAVMRLILMP